MNIAHVAQSVEHILGKDEVTGSIPVVGSQFKYCVIAHIYLEEKSWQRQSLSELSLM